MAMIGAAAGGMLGGLLGGAVAGSAPEYKAIGPQGELVYNIKALKDRANRTPLEIAANNAADTEQSRALLGDVQDVNQYSRALGGANNADMSRAISERYNRNYEKDLHNLQRQKYHDAFYDRAKRQQEFAAVNREMQSIATGQEQARMEQEMMATQMRNQVISSLFSSAGMMAGAGIAQAQAANRPLAGGMTANEKSAWDQGMNKVWNSGTQLPASGGQSYGGLA
jgi:hypothetical protein